MNGKYIVEIWKNCWLAPWTGNPGRTMLKENAKQYKSEHAAKCAIVQEKRVHPSRDFSKAKVELIINGE